MKKISEEQARTMMNYIIDLHLSAAELLKQREQLISNWKKIGYIEESLLDEARELARKIATDYYDADSPADMKWRTGELVRLYELAIYRLEEDQNEKDKRATSNKDAGSSVVRN